MDIRFDRSGSGITIVLSGRLTFVENANFRQVIERLSEPGLAPIDFDLGGLDYIDSAGLGMLLIARDAVANRGGRIRLRHISGQVKRILDLARFADFFDFEAEAAQ